MSAAVTRGEADLRGILRGMRRAIVAYSGGVDSATLLAVAAGELGADVLAVTGRSPSVASGEIDLASETARRIGARHLVVDTREFDNDNYRANASDRCFHCKDELFSSLWRIARQEDYAHVVDGFNADDGKSPLDRRPGHAAGVRLGVRSPLAEAGLGKEDIRRIARRLNLSVSEKPATPCLSSRVPYGTRIEIGDLRKIDLAESYLRARGFEVVRVRHYGAAATIEVPKERIASLSDCFQQVSNALRALGYARVEIDARGYRTGSLNAGQDRGAGAIARP